MQFDPPLIQATLLRRYKRFLADVRLDDGREVVAHCPNPGAMTGLAVPGQTVWLQPNDDPKKKLKFGWRLSQLDDGTLVCVDTTLANRIVREALTEGLIPELTRYTNLRAEVPYGDKNRADFQLSGDGLEDAIVEVKSVSLSRTPGLAEFPDTKTARGAKHMDALAEVALKGGRAVLIYLIQRTDCAKAGVAADIDPVYGTAADRAKTSGVEILTLRTRITPQEISVYGTC